MKEALEARRPRSWFKSVSAFANGVGGTLIFGIADDDSLVGIDDAKGDSETISESIKAHMDPIPQISHAIHSEESKDLFCSPSSVCLTGRWCKILIQTMCRQSAASPPSNFAYRKIGFEKVVKIKEY